MSRPVWSVNWNVRLLLLFVCLRTSAQLLQLVIDFFFAICHSRLQLIALIVKVLLAFLVESLAHTRKHALAWCRHGSNWIDSLGFHLEPCNPACYYLFLQSGMAVLLMIFIQMLTCVTSFFFPLEHVCNVSERSHMTYNITWCYFTFVLLDKFWILLLLTVGF